MASLGLSLDGQHCKQFVVVFDLGEVDYGASDPRMFFIQSGLDITLELIALGLIDCEHNNVDIFVASLDLFENIFGFGVFDWIWRVLSAWFLWRIFGTDECQQ
ncbi:unnamed protein product [Moneuplotes crassus]|uniref:Uncharacterized protein n=1 Tax=Euplotes crassus TaxID=5936 RepID=A0AAD2D789_EUPCR|nr:unnamed protein product [Moneuplotes crassus]